jgi:hypothetical protein
MNYRKFMLAAMLAITSSAQAQEGDVTRYTDTDTPKTTHTISFDVGPSWITSKIYTPSGTYKWRTGLELGVEYNCVFKKGYGFGFSFLHNTTSYPDAKATQIFVGPSFVYAGDFSKKWRGITEIGLGYSTFNDEHDTEVGLGVKYSIGLEYKLSDKFGISAKLRDVTVYLGDKEDDYGWNGRNKDEVNGVVRLAFQLGAYFHF